MDAFFGIVAILLLVAMFAVVAVLFIGILSMGQRGKVFSPKFSNKMMRLRVIVQAFAVVMIGILVLGLLMR